MQACDVGVIPHRDQECLRAMSPLKLYEYLASGLPVVAVDFPPIRGVDDERVVICSRDEWTEGVSRACALGPGTRLTDWSSPTRACRGRIACAPSSTWPSPKNSNRIEDPSLHHAMGRDRMADLVAAAVGGIARRSAYVIDAWPCAREDHLYDAIRASEPVFHRSPRVTPNSFGGTHGRYDGSVRRRYQVVHSLAASQEETSSPSGWPVDASPLHKAARHTDGGPAVSAGRRRGSHLGGV